MKATISARLAIAEWNRSISRLKGAGPSPRTIPAAKTARNPDPWARVAMPKDQQGAGQRPQRVQGLPRQRHPAHEPQQRPAARDADHGAHAHLQQEFAADDWQRLLRTGRPR